MYHLALPELLNLAKRLGEEAVRDYGLLGSALARPRRACSARTPTPTCGRRPRP